MRRKVLITLHLASIIAVSGFLKPLWVKKSGLGFYFSDRNCLKCSTLKHQLRFIGYIDFFNSCYKKRQDTFTHHARILGDYILSLLKE